jgi:hypothetical protein
MDRRMVRGFSAPPAQDGGMAELQQTLAAVQCEAEDLRRRDGERAGEWRAARQVFISLQEALTACHDAIGRLAEQAVLAPGEGAPRTLLRLSAELTISGLVAVGKQVRAVDCPGLKPGDCVVVTPRAEVPAPLVIGSARCALADRLRVDVGALVLITLGQVTIPLDVLVFRE